MARSPTRLTPACDAGGEVAPRHPTRGGSRGRGGDGGVSEPNLPEDAFADVPLLREIQRFLLSGSGPVNWELARQVGIASSTGGREDPQPTEEDQRGLEGAVRMAELTVADRTGRAPPREVTAVRAVRRAEWVEANVRGLRGLFGPTAERMARAVQVAQGEEQPELAEGNQMFEAMLERMTPLLMGAQVGAVLGALGQRVLGQYELPLPRADQPALLFVLPNIAEFEREWSLPSDELRAWVAMHETTHAFDLGQPWVREHFLGLVAEVAGALEFDLSAIQERLEGLDLSDPQRVSEALGGDLLTGELDDEQRLLLRRVQAFMAAAEGHADHVMAVLRRGGAPPFSPVDEALRPRHEGKRQGGGAGE